MVACLVIVAIISFVFIDRKMLKRMLVIFGATVAQMAVVLLLIGAAFVANVLAGVISLLMLRKK